MKLKEISKVIDERIKKASRHYRHILKNFDEDAIHDFRVEIKKLRAFLRLLSVAVVGQESLKIPTQLKDFYTTVGDFRNLQIHSQRISTLCHDLSLPQPDLYFRFLQNEQATLKKNLHALAKTISWEKIKKETGKDVPPAIQEDHCRAFLLHKKLYLQQLLALPLSDEALHEIRKLLKDILYNWQFIGLYATGTLPATIAQQKTIEALTTKLGDFQDLCTTTDLLQAYINNENNPDTATLQLLQQKLLSQKQAFKAAVCDDLMLIKEDVMRTF